MAFIDNLLPSFMTGLRTPAPRILLTNDFRVATTPFSSAASLRGSRLYTTPRGGKVEMKLSSSAYGFNFKGRNEILLEKIITQTPGHGHGDEAMDFLKGLADKFGVIVGMFPDPIGHKRKNYEQLAEWAAKHGFEEYNSPTALFLRDPGAGPKKVMKPE